MSQLGTDGSSNYAVEILVHGVRGLRVEPTSGTPNVIGGNANNIVGNGVFTATIAGGGDSGGPNQITDDYGTIGGGAFNTAGNSNLDLTDAQGATIGGGNGHHAQGAWSTVGGGYSNTASWSFATVGGGSANTASGGISVVAGGSNNSASGANALVGGGATNQASGQYAVVTGGETNQALSFGSVVGGGGGNVAGLSSGGLEVVAGGANNQATGGYSTVGGGLTNTASGDKSTVAGGVGGLAGGLFGVVGGGNTNRATGGGSVVSGGETNTASGVHSCVPGGVSNSASGTASFGAGQHASADFDGCFVWADDSTTTSLTCGAVNKFVARAAGGAYFYSNSGATAGVKLTPGANAWAAVSDRNAKRDFVDVKQQDVLSRVAALPMTTWSYKSEPGVRHMGPMAQDFRAAFGLGTDDRSIVTVDADGVALAAIQGLDQKVKALETSRSELRGEVVRLGAQNRELRRRLERLEAGIPMAPAGILPGGSPGLVAVVLGVGIVFVAGRRRRDS